MLGQLSLQIAETCFLRAGSFILFCVFFYFYWLLYVDTLLYKESHHTVVPFLDQELSRFLCNDKKNTSVCGKGEDVCDSQLVSIMDCDL
jgi:hypothetical protein